MSVANANAQRKSAAKRVNSRTNNPPRLRLVETDGSHTPPQWLLDIPERCRHQFTNAECLSPTPPAWWLEIPAKTRTMLTQAARIEEDRLAAIEANPDGFKPVVGCPPCFINIGSQQWSVWLAEDCYLDGEEVYGLCCPRERAIAISAAVRHPGHRMDTLWHEIGHAAGVVFGRHFNQTVCHEELAQIFSLAMGAIDAPTIARLQAYLLYDKTPMARAHA